MASLPEKIGLVLVRAFVAWFCVSVWATFIQWEWVHAWETQELRLIWLVLFLLLGIFGRGKDDD